MTYQEIISLLANNILLNFDEVYFDAEIVNLKKEKYPAVSIADEWIKLVPTDQKETIYIRRNGDDEVIEDLKLSSCSGKAYRMRSNLRVVFFRDHATDQNKILSYLMQSVLVMGTKLKSIIRDKWKLLKEESNGDYNFGPATAYFAIDIFILWILQPDTCIEDFCIDIVNPLKKEQCPVVA